MGQYWQWEKNDKAKTCHLEVDTKQWKISLESTKQNSSFPINMKHFILFVGYNIIERRKKIFFSSFDLRGSVLWHLCHFSFLDVWHTTLILKLNFQLQEDKGTCSDVVFGHSQLLGIGYLWFQNSWTTWAFPSFCQEPLHHPFLDLHTPLLFPSLTRAPLSFIYVVELAAASVYCWCLSLCTDCCSLLR